MINGNWRWARFTSICPTADKPILIQALTCLVRRWASHIRFSPICHVERSRDSPRRNHRYCYGILRLRFASLRMRMTMKVTEENVLVVPRGLFDELGSFHGLNFEPQKYLDAFLSRGNNFFLSRPEAEINPAYKQIIPYALIAFQDKVVYYVRGKKAGEQRLVAKGSIGIGGHMNETDESLFAMDEQAYRAGVEREVNEEVKIDAPFEDRIVALLNDDTTEVGSVHLGVVHVFILAEPKVEKREAMITGLTFLAKNELFGRRETMETWSQICLDSLVRLLL